LGHEPLAEHVRGGCAHGIHVAGELHAARLAASAGVHLCLHNPHGTAELLGSRDGFLGARHHLARRHGNPVAAEHLLRLVLVQIHRRKPVARKERAFSSKRTAPDQPMTSGPL
jgi:hypothetical protein